jgi:hypothetical protein
MIYEEKLNYSWWKWFFHSILALFNIIKAKLRYNCTNDTFWWIEINKEIYGWFSKQCKGCTEDGWNRSLKDKKYQRKTYDERSPMQKL